METIRTLFGRRGDESAKVVEDEDWHEFELDDEQDDNDFSRCADDDGTVGVFDPSEVDYGNFTSEEILEAANFELGLCEDHEYKDH